MTDLVRWEPFNDLRAIRDEMNRFLAGPFGWLQNEGLTRAGMWQPAIDVHETDQDVIVTADLPGFDREEIEVAVTGDTLTLSGEHKESEDVTDERYVRRERRYGRFVRTVPLPVEVNSAGATAGYKNGTLRVTLPKSERARPKTIKVDVH